MESSRETERRHLSIPAIGRSGEDTTSDLASAVFNCTQESIVVTDAQGTIVAVNPAFSATTGYAPLEVVGKNMRALQSGRQDTHFYREMWAQVIGTGYWRGEIWNRRKNGEVYPALLTISSVRNRAGDPTHYIGMCSDLSRIKKSELELDRLAHHDELTGLPNRRSLMSWLGHLLQRATHELRGGAVVFVDLDRFKRINDSLGHGAGDELLTLVTHRLRSGLRAGDFLARFGGDEFIVLLDDASHHAAGRVAAHIIERLSEPFVLSGEDEICIGASVGISMFPSDCSDAALLLQHADTALYHAKAAGKSTYRFYSTDLTTVASERLSIDTRLRRAMSRNELVVYYQPLVSLLDNRIFGFEALVRWNDPDRGLVPPADFLPVAEETGLIVPIGAWILRTACAQMKRWLDQGCRFEQIAVNISARQFRAPAFVANIIRTLDDTGLAPRNLELEITEDVLMGSDDTTLATLTTIRGLGVRLAIDDFGTGYSSLAYLKRLPVNKLKLDRSFVQDLQTDPASRAIVTTVVALAKSLGHEVLAEGIETDEQRAILVASGCILGQGYLFAPPVPADATAGLAGLVTSMNERKLVADRGNVALA